jgi:inner membrane protein
MDLVTQGVLGAAVGYGVAGHRLGRKAIVLGALGGMLPDADVLLSDANEVAYWATHRGITHSLFFGPIVGVLFAWIALGLTRARVHARFSDSPTILSFGQWWWFWCAVLITHPMLDVLTTYGTQIFAPFDRTPYGFSVISIIDPIYTFVLIAGLVVVWRARSAQTPKERALFPVDARRPVWIALAISCAYLSLSGTQNVIAQRHAALERPDAKVTAYTTIFSPWLRRVVAATEDGLEVGFVATLKPQPIRWTRLYHDKEALALFDQMRSHSNVQIYTNFARGPQHVTIATSLVDGHSELRVSDARFGVPGESVAGFWGLAVPIAGGVPQPDAAFRYTADRGATRDRVAALFRAKVGMRQDVF